MPATRTPVSRQQTLASATVLLLLAVTAAAVIWASFDYDPARWGWGKGPPSGQAGLLAGFNPPGLDALGPVQAFGPANLSDKINGKAELYLSAGFTDLQARRYALAGQPQKWLEMLLYKMKSAEAAYSVFSGQRRAGAKTLSLAPNAYGTSNAVYLALGQYYAEIVASSRDKDLLAAANQAAAALIKLLPKAKGKAPAEPELFPPAGMKPGSLALLAKDAFGMAGLDRVYMAAYPAPGGELIAFLSRRSGAQQAADLAKQYEHFLMQNGGSLSPVPKDIPDSRLVNIFDTWELVFARGGYLAGVRGHTDQNATLELGRRLYKRLKEAQP